MRQNSECNEVYARVSTRCCSPDLAYAASATAHTSPPPLREEPSLVRQRDRLIHVLTIASTGPRNSSKTGKDASGAVTSDPSSHGVEIDSDSTKPTTHRAAAGQRSGTMARSG